LNVRQGEAVVTANLVSHADVDHFDDPETFRADRFLAKDGTFASSKHFMAFGGGLGVCKGRHFAVFSEMLFVVRVLETFDDKVLDLIGSQGVEARTACGTKFLLPCVKPDRIGSGSMMPEGDVMLELSLRANDS